MTEEVIVKKEAEAVSRSGNSGDYEWKAYS